MASLSTDRTTTGGFTLIEILLAMLFLSLGIMGVIAFFFLGATDSREAVRMTRSTMIAKEVRQGLIHALRYPVHIEDVETPIYRFELPTVRSAHAGEAPSIGPEASLELPEYQTERPYDQIDGFYFVIDDVAGRMPAGLREQTLSTLEEASDPTDAVLDLPRQAAPRPDSPAMDEVLTWDLRDGFKRSSFPEVSVFNEDDSHMYSFRILIRRGPSAAGEPGGMFEPGDVLCVTVYVFRQFDPAAAMNTPGFDWATFDQYTGQASYSTVGGPVQGIQPVASFHFYIGSS